MSAVRTWLLWTGVSFGTYFRYRKPTGVLLGLAVAAPVVYVALPPRVSLLALLISLLPWFDLGTRPFPYPGWTVPVVLVAGPPVVAALALALAEVRRAIQPDRLGMSPRSIAALSICGSYAAYLAAPVFLVGLTCGALLFAAAVLVYWASGRKTPQPRFKPTPGALSRSD